MANSYLKVYIQFVFSVKNRYSLINVNYKEKLHKYITGIVKKYDCKLLIINSVPDHIHLLTTLSSKIAIADLMKEVKGGSSKFINENNFCKTKFAWQDGYGAFSYSESQVPDVIKYIENQEKHHKKKTFQEEYLEFLKRFNIPYDKKYVFDLE